MICNLLKTIHWVINSVPLMNGRQNAFRNFLLAASGPRLVMRCSGWNKNGACARYKAKLHLTFLKFSAHHCSDIFDSKKTIPLKTCRHIHCSFHESEVLCVEPTTNWKLDKSSYIKKVGFLHWINKYHWNGLLATNLDFTINVFILN